MKPRAAHVLFASAILAAIVCFDASGQAYPVKLTVDRAKAAAIAGPQIVPFDITLDDRHLGEWDVHAVHAGSHHARHDRLDVDAPRQRHLLAERDRGDLRLQRWLLRNRDGVG